VERVQTPPDPFTPPNQSPSPPVVRKKVIHPPSPAKKVDKNVPKAKNHQVPVANSQSKKAEFSTDGKSIDQIKLEKKRIKNAEKRRKKRAKKRKLKQEARIIEEETIKQKMAYFENL
jgi:hypothetical protein